MVSVQFAYGTAVSLPGTASPIMNLSNYSIYGSALLYVDITNCDLRAVSVYTGLPPASCPSHATVASGV